LTASKAILIAVLLVISLNLLLYGFMRRRIAAAKRDENVDG
jgi:hypothetical protein